MPTDRLTVYRTKLAEALKGMHRVVKHPYGWLVILPKKCENCGAEFFPSRTNGQRYCAALCVHTKLKESKLKWWNANKEGILRERRNS